MYGVIFIVMSLLSIYYKNTDLMIGAGLIAIAAELQVIGKRG